MKGFTRELNTALAVYVRLAREEFPDDADECSVAVMAMLKRRTGNRYIHGEFVGMLTPGEVAVHLATLRRLYGQPIAGFFTLGGSSPTTAMGTEDQDGLPAEYQVDVDRVREMYDALDREPSLHTDVLTFRAPLPAARQVTAVALNGEVTKLLTTFTDDVRGMTDELKLALRNIGDASVVNARLNGNTSQVMANMQQMMGSLRDGITGVQQLAGQFLNSLDSKLTKIAPVLHIPAGTFDPMLNELQQSNRRHEALVSAVDKLAGVMEKSFAGIDSRIAALEESLSRRLETEVTFQDMVLETLASMQPTEQRTTLVGSRPAPSAELPATAEFLHEDQRGLCATWRKWAGEHWKYGPKFLIVGGDMAKHRNAQMRIRMAFGCHTVHIAETRDDEDRDRRALARISKDYDVIISITKWNERITKQARERANELGIPFITSYAANIPELARQLVNWLQTAPKVGQVATA